MFKFNFLQNTKDEENQEEPPIKWVESKEISINTVLINRILNHKDVEFNTIELKNVNIQYISPTSVIKILKENDIKSDIIRAENNRSDLIAGIYEGGLKIWECTYDLVRFIDERQFSFTNKNVLDLGCGMGIIGMLAVLKGANVHFQDYNSEVIQYLTIPNVFNAIDDKESLMRKTKFYCGDWESFTSILSNVEKRFQYDYIFTSETIYNTSNYSKLIELFKLLLKQNGKIYLAAKTYYFGVGGGLRQFEDRLKEAGRFDYSTVWKCGEGINREILEII